jgi:hypothetical protein
MQSFNSMDLQALQIGLSRPALDAKPASRPQPIEQEQRESAKRDAPTSAQDTRTTAEKLEAATRNEKVYSRIYQEDVSARAFNAIETFENIRHFDPQESIIDTYA